MNSQQDMATVPSYTGSIGAASIHYISQTVISEGQSLLWPGLDNITACPTDCSLSWIKLQDIARISCQVLPLDRVRSSPTRAEAPTGLMGRSEGQAHLLMKSRERPQSSWASKVPPRFERRHLVCESKLASYHVRPLSHMS